MGAHTPHAATRGRAVHKCPSRRPRRARRAPGPRGASQTPRLTIVKVTSTGGSIFLMNTADLGLPVAVPSTALFTDQYELPILQAALRSGTADRRSVFEVFTRR